MMQHGNGRNEMTGKRMRFILAGISVFILLSGCAVDANPPVSHEETPAPVIGEEKPEPPSEENENDYPEESEEKAETLDPVSDMEEEDLLAYMENKYGGKEVTVFGENIEGVITSIETERKIAVLTFDACGGPHGSGYDEELLTYLMEERIPATLFINGRWIEENKETMKMLSQQDLFDIENHGYSHRPLSLDGSFAYGIRGTEGVEEVLHEVMKNQELIFSYTGRRPRYFRSGTAYYDDVTVEILTELGLKAVNYDVLGDAGATFNKEQMIRSAGGVKEGSIFLYHMNQPGKKIAEGVKHVVPMLMDMGYDFVKLSEYDDALK